MSRSDGGPRGLRNEVVTSGAAIRSAGPLRWRCGSVRVASRLDDVLRSTKTRVLHALA